MRSAPLPSLMHYKAWADATNSTTWPASHDAMDVLSAADSVDDPKRGSTVCGRLEGDKPQIHVNLNNAALENIRFGSNLNRLTTIVHRINPPSLAFHA